MSGIGSPMPDGALKFLRISEQIRVDLPTRLESDFTGVKCKILLTLIFKMMEKALTQVKEKYIIIALPSLISLTDSCYCTSGSFWSF